MPKLRTNYRGLGEQKRRFEVLLGRGPRLPVRTPEYWTTVTLYLSCGPMERDRYKQMLTWGPEKLAEYYRQSS